MAEFEEINEIEETELDTIETEGNVEEIEEYLDEDDDEVEEIYVKNKTIRPQAMTLDDAIMQMESLDHDFFIYEDIEDHTLSVVYRRKDGGYGVIDIE